MAGKIELSFPLHPMLKDAYEMLRKKFAKIVIEEQDLLSVEKHQEYFLRVLPTDQLRMNVKARWKKESCETGRDKWVAYIELLKEYRAGHPKDTTLEASGLPKMAGLRVTITKPEDGNGNG